jgi:hypothetical protein
MKFLCVPGGGLIAAPNDDIVYEIQMHQSSNTYGLLDTKVGYSLKASSKYLVAILLHPMPGNIRESVPKIDVSNTAFKHGLWINDGIHLYDMPTSSMQRDIRVLTPTSIRPVVVYKLGNVLLMDPTGQAVIGELAITDRCDAAGNDPPGMSCCYELTRIVGRGVAKPTQHVAAKMHTPSPKAMVLDAAVSSSPAAAVDARPSPPRCPSPTRRLTLWRALLQLSSLLSPICRLSLIRVR